MAGDLHDEILTEIELDRRGEVSLQQQLYERTRGLILAGRLVAGARLPSTRRTASRLGLSRNTVLAAFEQLALEGYVETRRASGTYVSHALAGTAPPSRPAQAPVELSSYGRRLARTRTARDQDRTGPRPLQPGVPALDAFPFKTWRRLTAAALRELARSDRRALAYGWTGGYPPLREAIARHLRVSRGVRCEPGQILITAGTQGALDLTARMLLEPRDVVWFEDPGYVSAREVLQAAGHRLVPVPVDDEGLVVSAATQREPRARLAYVTPSHQYPTSATLSLARRVQLLAWAARHAAWIFEDDYDSEFRHAGKPLTALQGQDEGGRVLYAGTFSKTLFPALRLGYLVLPPALAGGFLSARALADRSPPILEQMVLARFVAQGHFARHVQRMRQLYASRRAVLERALLTHAGGFLDIAPSQTGLQLSVRLPDGVDDVALVERLERRGLGARALSGYALEPLARGGLCLGFGSTPEADLERAVRVIRDAFEELCGPRRCRGQARAHDAR